MVNINHNLFAGKVFLLVDDEIMLRDLIAMELDELGCRCLLADNGVDAFELIKNNKIDLLISDVRMPKGSGIDLLKELKNESLNEDFPIIMMSGFTDLSLEQAQGFGASTIVAKPFLISDLIPIIVDALNLKKPN